MSTEKSSLPLPEKWKILKDLSQYKNHFSWKHHIINEIKKWKLWNPCRILSKCFVWRRTLMNNHSFQLFYFTNYTRNKHNLNHESYISSIYVHLSWDSIHPPHTGALDKMVAVLAQLTRYKIKDGGRGVCKSRMERLVILYVNYTRTPDNLVKSSAFYTRSLSVRSQMVAPVAASQPSLRDHRMIVHHTAQLKTAWTIRGIS